MTPAPFLTDDSIPVLIDALLCYRRERERTTTWASQHLQGTAQTALMVKAGDQLREADSLLFELRQRRAASTGMPDIQHHNAGIESVSGRYPPLTHEEQAQEANTRG